MNDARAEANARQAEDQAATPHAGIGPEASEIVGAGAASQPQKPQHHARARETSPRQGDDADTPHGGFASHQVEAPATAHQPNFCADEFTSWNFNLHAPRRGEP